MSILTAARMQRALNNHFEGLILFTLAVVVVTLGQQSSPVTQPAPGPTSPPASLYVPAYAFGWSPWRSVIWAVGYCRHAHHDLAALI